MVSNNELQELIASIQIPCIMYVPSGLLVFSPLEVTEDIKKHPIFDTLVIRKENGEAAEYEDELHAFEILKKEHVLNSNIFKLLEIKGRNNEDAFKFLIEKYITRLRSFHELFIWLYEHVEEDVSNVSTTAKYNLEYQKNITGEHLKELEKRFSGFNSIATESVESLLANTSINKQKSDKQSIAQDDSENPLSKTDNRKQKPQKRKKLVLATVEEVDEYLLSTIFNVKKPQNTTKTPQ